MTLPVRNLTVLQNWDCHTCGDCCRELEGVISDEEKRRIEALNLAGDPEIGAGPWFARKGWFSDKWTLKHRPEGGCVFLTSANRCRLQERFGPGAKPFACNFFPFLLMPAGDHWRVGLRFSCPSVVASQGRPVSRYQAALAQFAVLLEKHVGQTGENVPPPLMGPGQKASWPEVIRFTQALVEIVQDRAERLERRLRNCLALIALCRRARFGAISGDRFAEFMELVRAGLVDAPRPPADLAPPGWIGRILFRTLMLTVYARKDWGRHQGNVTPSLPARARAGWRFIRGSGSVPLLNRFLGATTFEEVESRTGFLPADIDETLERYYLIKLSSLQYCGP
jgi:lysine-N-methylase